MRRATTILASILLLAPGCGLYTGHNGGGPDGGGPVPDAQCAPIPGPLYQLRDPQTGQCDSYSSGGSCGVVNGGPSTGGATPTSPPSNGIAIPSWGLCTSQCTGLDESSCLATPGCRAAYLDTGESLTPSGDAPTKQYYACWATDQSGPVEGGGCDGLDAYSCSRHDDCIAIHASTCGPGTASTSAACLGDFESCAPEPPSMSCTNDSDCDPGYRCDTSNCPSDCPAGVPCDCRGTCVANSPGSCEGDVTCKTPTPACPSGTVPGIANGCYTGYCIPLDQCLPPPPPQACDTVTDEATCIGRTDCTPIYQGQNCSCDASGACTCQTWVFSSCQAAGTPPPLPPVDGGSAPTSDGGTAPPLMTGN